MTHQMDELLTMYHDITVEEVRKIVEENPKCVNDEEKRIMFIFYRMGDEAIPESNEEIAKKMGITRDELMKRAQKVVGKVTFLKHLKDFENGTKVPAEIPIEGLGFSMRLYVRVKDINKIKTLEELQKSNFFILEEKMSYEEKAEIARVKKSFKK